MKHRELRLPLIQSAIVLVVIFFLIAFVAGSDAHGFFGGITSIFRGLFFSILFVIALVVALIISIAILIAIFFGAVALYSPDTSKEMLSKFRDNLSSLLVSWKSCCSKDSLCSSDQQPPIVQEEAQNFIETVSEQEDVPVKVFAEQDEVQLIKKTLTTKFEDLGQAVSLTQEQNSTLSSSLTELKEVIAANPAEEIIKRADQLESRQEEVTASVAAISEKFNSLEANLNKHGQAAVANGASIQDLQSSLAALKEELQQLKSVPPASVVKENDAASSEEEDHRIFSYIEKDSDKEQFTNLINEAVEKGMTYAEIDSFLSESMTKKVDAIIKEHPSLTKAYIRSCKNN